MSDDIATGVVTNGEGKVTTAHLNLTVSLADVQLRPKKRVVGRLLTREERSILISEGRRAQIMHESAKRRAAEEAARKPKAKFAGFDPHEIRLQLPRAE